MTDSTSPKPFVFVLMPFDKKFDEIYKLGIKSACIEAGAYCERVDEQIYTENMLDRIYNQIGKADIVISEMTGRNPNVFYETGYAHALGKQVILLTHYSEDIPFDMKHYPHIIHEGDLVRLHDEIIRRVSWIIRNPQESLSNVDQSIEIYSIGSPLTNMTIVYDVFDADNKILPGAININFDFHNPSRRLLDNKNIQLGVVLPFNFRDGLDHMKYVHLSREEILVFLSALESIFPDGWQSLRLVIDVHKIRNLKVNDIVNARLKIFTEVVIREINFKIEFTQIARK